MTIAHDFPGFDPQTFASQGNAVLGIRDSGKSYTAVELAERLFDAGIPFVAFDPIGRWRFIRVPGAGKGYPVVVAGGAAGDLPLTVETAPAIVRAAMESGVSLVIDLYDMEVSKADWKRIVGDSVRVLLYGNGQHGLRHIFIEEAAEFCPQRVGPDQGRVYAEIEKLARMGGNARLGYTLINQRAEEVNKAVLELCDNLFLHRQKGRNSLNALTKWLDVADVRAGREIISTLPTLPQGECWAWMAGTDRPVHIKVPPKNSFEPDRRAMGRQDGATTAKTVDVAGFVADLRAALATELDPKESESGPKRPKSTKAPPKSAEIDIALEIERASAEAFERGKAYGQMCVCNSIVGELRQLANDIKEIADRYDMGTGDPDHIPPPVITDDHRPPSVHTDVHSRPAVETTGKNPPESTLRYQKVHSRPNGEASTGGAELRPLRVLAARHPARFTKAQWATLAGMKRTGGTWQTYVSRLRTAGYINEDGGTVGLTREGLKAAGHVERPSAGSVTEQWKSALGSGPAKMIDQLVRAHPHGMDRANLADRVGMTVSGGTFSTYLSRLKSNGLVDVVGRKVVASQTLFIDGAR